MVVVVVGVVVVAQSGAASPISTTGGTRGAAGSPASAELANAAHRGRHSAATSTAVREVNRMPSLSSRDPGREMKPG